MIRLKVQLCSPDGAKRNPGPAQPLARPSRISLRSIRATTLIMVLEKFSPKEILARELATGAPIIYRLNADATVASKLDLAV